MADSDRCIGAGVLLRSFAALVNTDLGYSSDRSVLTFRIQAPPSLATVGDDVYVAYSMAAPEGTGVFFAHSMGSMLHAPVPVIYGERLVSTARLCGVGPSPPAGRGRSPFRSGAAAGCSRATR